MTIAHNRFSLLEKLTLVAFLVACIVVSLGAFTRLVHAGLGCPDWPGCYGHLTWPTSSAEVAAAEALFPEFPVEHTKTWPEMVHRYCAGSLGLLVFTLTGLLLHQNRKQRKNHSTMRYPTKHALALCAMIVLQGAFGMWTVTLKLWPQVVTAHLLGGFTTLALIWLLFVRLRQCRLNNSRAQLFATPTSPPTPIPAMENPVVSAQEKRFLIKALTALIVLVIIQISLGGWTSANYAALACPELPTCQGQIFPEANFQQGFNIFQAIGPNYLGGHLDGPARTAIHLSHRIGALLVTVLSIFCLWQLLKRRLLTPTAVVISSLLVVQIGLGIANILLALPLPVAVAHNGVAALLLLALITALYQLHHLPVLHHAQSTKSTHSPGVHHEPSNQPAH